MEESTRGGKGTSRCRGRENIMGSTRIEGPYISKLSCQLICTYGDMDDILRKFEGRRRRHYSQRPIRGSRVHINEELISADSAGRYCLSHIIIVRLD